MDYRKVVETWLREYKELVIQLESYRALYNECELQVKEGRALTYDKDKISKTNNFYSETESQAITLANIKTTINHLDNKILVINQAIKKLNEKEKRVIELRYMQTNKWDKPLTWVQISYMMNYDISWCKELRRRAIDALTEIMFGKGKKEGV